MQVKYLLLIPPNLRRLEGFSMAAFKVSTDSAGTIEQSIEHNCETNQLPYVSDKCRTFSTISRGTRNSALVTPLMRSANFIMRIATSSSWLNCVSQVRLRQCDGRKSTFRFCIWQGQEQQLHCNCSDVLHGICTRRILIFLHRGPELKSGHVRIDAFYLSQVSDLFLDAVLWARKQAVW